MPRKAQPPADPSRKADPPPGSLVPASNSTFVLLRRVQDGDSEALDQLCRRYLPRLRRWATGRLPEKARGYLDTDDLIRRALRALPAPGAR